MVPTFFIFFTFISFATLLFDVIFFIYAYCGLFLGITNKFSYKTKDFSGPPVEMVKKELDVELVTGCQESGSISGSLLMAAEDHLSASPGTMRRQSLPRRDRVQKSKQEGASTLRVGAGGAGRGEGGGEHRRARSASHGPSSAAPESRPTSKEAPREVRAIENLTRKLSQTAMKEGTLVSVDKVYDGRKRKKEIEKWREEMQSQGGMKVRVLMEIEELREVEKIEAEVESPLGDSYFINSVEEFYCDASKGGLNIQGGDKGDDIRRFNPRKDEGWIMLEARNKPEYFGKCIFLFFSLLFFSFLAFELLTNRIFTLALAYPELWVDRKKRIQKSSSYGSLPSWSKLFLLFFLKE